MFRRARHPWVHETLSNSVIVVREVTILLAALTAAIMIIDMQL